MAAGSRIEHPTLSLEQVHELARAHSDHPSIGLALSPRMRVFTNAAGRAAICYRETGGVLYPFGGVIGPVDERDAVLKDFGAFADEVGRRIFAVQLRDEDVDLYHRRGYRLNQLGCSYTLDIRDFSLSGGRFMRMRNKLKQPRKAGVEVHELGQDLPVTPEVELRLDEITQAWLGTKGRNVHEIEFLVGETSAIRRKETRCFVASRDGEIIAFITYVPSYGRYAGMMHDLTRRMPDSPPGTMELINYTAITRFQAEGIAHLNFGLTPFIGVDDRLGSHSPAVARVMRFLARHGGALYPASSQVAYKEKWHPQVIVPEYIAYRGRFRVSYLWHLLRLTQVIGGSAS